ncbi:hypothetical protein WUBG_07058 [Wuchereria bancrofti]|uniref:Uncharacterized protein n=1 Tax=Wuchereria bancrofti TaxID=6293 RepID=J9EXY7_WUCBA|nr:hypothetical protein WUBG_07058 [Wuchereria bancrofti]
MDRIRNWLNGAYISVQSLIRQHNYSTYGNYSSDGESVTTCVGYALDLLSSYGVQAYPQKVSIDDLVDYGEWFSNISLPNGNSDNQRNSCNIAKKTPQMKCSKCVQPPTSTHTLGAIYAYSVHFEINCLRSS